MAQIIFIRHGETDYNIQKRYCGVSDPPLNKNGKQQIGKTASLLRDIPVSKIYSSDLARAYESARIISANIPVERSGCFREMDFGVFEGLRHEDIMRLHGDRYMRWLDNPLDIAPPGGESLRRLRVRVEGGLQALVSRHKGQIVALVTHEGPIKVVLFDTLRCGLGSFWKLKIANGAFTVVDYSDVKAPKVIKMDNVNGMQIGIGDEK